jgi:tape measure domain-containing protein
MADLKIRISAVTDGLKKGLNGAKGMLGNFGSKLTRSINVTKTAFAGMAAVAVGAFVQITRVGAKFEQTSVAFKTMLGSADKATNVLDKLIAFSTKTPFEPDEIFAAAKVLLAFGQTADEAVDTIKLLGDVSAGTGKDLNELARIYGKVFVKGKMQAEELNQLSEAGIPIIKELEKQYKTNAAAIFKMGSAGKLSFQDLQKSFKNMTQEGGMFFKAMENQSETFNGKISTLKGNWDEMLRSFSKSDGLKKFIDLVNEGVKGVTEMSKQMLTSGEKDPTTMDAISAGAEHYASKRKPGIIGQIATMGPIGPLLMSLLPGTPEKDAAAIAKLLQPNTGKTTKAEIDAHRKKMKMIFDESKAAERQKKEAAARMGGGGLNTESTLQTLSRDQALSVGQMLTPLSSVSMDPSLRELERQTEILRDMKDALRHQQDQKFNYWEDEMLNVFKDGA